MNKSLKAVIITVLSLICAVLIVLSVIYVPYLSFTGVSVKGIGRQQTEYVSDEEFTRISNIPYDEYISSDSPETYTIVELSHKSGDMAQNTEILQKAIDKCSKKGGTLLIPEGNHFVGFITLKSNVNIFLAEGCNLNMMYYAEYIFNEKSVSSFFSAKNESNITIGGGGKIICNGAEYYDAEQNEPFFALRTFNLYTKVNESKKMCLTDSNNYKKPIIFSFESCSNILIDGLCIQDAPSKSLYFDKCKSVSIKNLVIDGNYRIDATNAISVNGADNFNVEHCFIVTGGNGIEIASKGYKVVDFKVRDCKICAFENGIYIGNKTVNNIQNVSIEKCSFFIPDGLGTGLCGIVISSLDGAKISGVTVTDIMMDGVPSPLLLWLGERLSGSKKSVGSIHDCVFENIDAVNTSLPSAFKGTDNKHIYNITVNNYNAVYRDGKERLSVSKDIVSSYEKKEAQIWAISCVSKLFPDYERCSSLPCYGIYFANCDELTIDAKTTPRNSTKLPEFNTSIA